MHSLSCLVSYSGLLFCFVMDNSLFSCTRHTLQVTASVHLIAHHGLSLDSYTYICFTAQTLGAFPLFPWELIATADYSEKFFPICSAFAGSGKSIFSLLISFGRSLSKAGTVHGICCLSLEASSGEMLYLISFIALPSSICSEIKTLCLFQCAGTAN